MPSSGMLRRLILVRTKVSEERIASIIKVTRIGEVGTTLKVIRNQSNLLQLLITTNVVASSPILLTLMMEAIRSSETLILARAMRNNIPDDCISYI
jgi:hypothetical protein